MKKNSYKKNFIKNNSHKNNSHKNSSLKNNYKLLTGALMIILLILAAVFTPFIARSDPYATNLAYRLEPPGSVGLLGTDHLGRDVFARLVHGARLSIVISLVTLLISLVVGLVTGLAAGYFRGICDSIITFVMEVLLAFPGMILSLAVVGILGAGMFNAVAAVALVSWIEYARLVRGMTLSLKEREFVKAAKISGTGHIGIITRHILPNVINPVIIYSATHISVIMLQLAALSFLGLGVQLPTAEWGAMLNDARGFMVLAPWLTIAPSAALVFMVSAFNLLGEGLTERGVERTQNF